MLNIGGTGKLAAGKMTVQVDTKQALADIRAVQIALNNLSLKVVTITVNTGASVSQITTLQSALIPLEAALTALLSMQPIVEIIPGLTLALNNAAVQFWQLAISVEKFLIQVNQIPDSKDFKITDNIQTVMGELAQLQGVISSLHGTTIMISVITSYSTVGSPYSTYEAIWPGGVPTVNYPYPEGPPPMYPGYQYGGIIPEDMLAYVHRGEEVVPANEVRSGGTGSSRTPYPSVLNFENQTVVQVDGETVQRAIETRMIRSQQVGSQYS
jgi:hypothetical protein